MDGMAVFGYIVWHSIGMAWNTSSQPHTQYCEQKIYTTNKINGYENKDIKFIATTMRGKFIIN